jgi:phospholipase C
LPADGELTNLSQPIFSGTGEPGAQVEVHGLNPVTVILTTTDGADDHWSETPSRALPYELHVSARSNAAAGTLQLLFANTGKAGAVFHVYDRLHLDRLPRRYTVEAGKSLDDSWNVGADREGEYDLWVLGPNGFHRHFRGKLDAQRVANAAVPEVRVCYDIANGNVYLSMLNTGKNAAKFTIRPQAYREDGPWTLTVTGGDTAEQHWELADSGRWYDFAVTCDTDASYYRRFAGRVETGQHSVSDPAMGVTER